MKYCKDRKTLGIKDLINATLKSLCREFKAYIRLTGLLCFNWVDIKILLVTQKQLFSILSFFSYSKNVLLCVRVWILRVNEYWMSWSNCDKSIFYEVLHAMWSWNMSIKCKEKSVKQNAVQRWWYLELSYFSLL